MSIKIDVPYTDHSTDRMIITWLHENPAIRYAWDGPARHIIFEYEEDAIAFKLKFEL